MKKIKINDVEVTIVTRTAVKGSTHPAGSVLVIVPDGTDAGTIPAVLLEYFVHEYNSLDDKDSTKSHYVSVGDMGEHPELMASFASNLEKQRVIGRWDELIAAGKKHRAEQVAE